MPQPFVVIKNPHVVIRNVVNLDIDPDANLAGRELVVDLSTYPTNRRASTPVPAYSLVDSRTGEAMISSSSTHALWIMSRSIF